MAWEDEYQDKPKADGDNGTVWISAIFTVVFFGLIALVLSRGA